VARFRHYSYHQGKADAHKPGHHWPHPQK
jgi:hypothetical protein